MAVLFSKAAQYRVDKMRARAQAEAALDECNATLGLKFRARATGERKTEAYFKARIVLHPRYKKLAAAKENAVYREELSKLILDAYRMRRDAIKIIADHRGYDSIREESIIEGRNQMRKMSAAARKLDARRRKTEKE